MYKNQLKDLNVTAKTRKLLEENIGVDLGLDNVFCHDIKSVSNKRKIGKLDFIKIKTFVLQGTLSRKWTDNPQKKILMNYVSDKVLIFKMHKALLQLNNKKTTQL